MMSVLEQAKHLRSYIEKAMQSLSDADALQAKTLYPFWEDLVELGKVDTEGKPGFRFYYNGDLFKCTNPDPEFQKDWVPGIYTSAIYVRIDEAHSGSIDDPIPAARGMEYTYGLHYFDPEDGKSYVCQRAGANEGDTIQLAYLPHELIGHYFVEA